MLLRRYFRVPKSGARKEFALNEGGCRRKFEVEQSIVSSRPWIVVALKSFRRRAKNSKTPRPGITDLQDRWSVHGHSPKVLILRQREQESKKTDTSRTYLQLAPQDIATFPELGQCGLLRSSLCSSTKILSSNTRLHSRLPSTAEDWISI